MKRTAVSLMPLTMIMIGSALTPLPADAQPAYEVHNKQVVISSVTVDGSDLVIQGFNFGNDPVSSR